MEGVDKRGPRGDEWEAETSKGVAPWFLASKRQGGTNENYINGLGEWRKLDFHV